MRMVYAAREGYEAKLVAAASAAGAPRLAQQYVDALRPCYEWEGFHDCPEREALFAEQHLRDHPDTPFRDLLRVLAAHRWLCAAEGYEYEQKPGEALRARRNYDEAVTSATVDSRSVLLTTAATELKASGRCHVSDPFRKREPGATDAAPPVQRQMRAGMFGAPRQSRIAFLNSSWHRARLCSQGLSVKCFSNTGKARASPNWPRAQIARLRSRSV